MNQLAAIIGPTGIGKSRLAVRLAAAFNGEVVSADSRQIYRYMDIGTAKPDSQQMSSVPHHLIDIINPDENFSLTRFQQLATKTISSIQRRGRLPVVVGGSGQYVWALLEGWGVPRVPPNMELRQRLEKRVAAGEREGLYAELLARDPEYARQIDSRNVRRVIRAIEVSQDKPGSPISRQQSEPPYKKLIIGLTTDREDLYSLVDRRVDRMIEQGLVEEVQGLVSRGYGYSLPSMSAIGYRQIGAYLRGEATLEADIQQIKFESHRFVRQQYNWFKLGDSRINWFDIRDPRALIKINALVEGFISNNDN